MQAVTIPAFGDADVLTFGEVPTPEPKPGHVLVKVDAVGVNYYDTLVRSGAVSRSIPLPTSSDRTWSGMSRSSAPGSRT